MMTQTEATNFDYTALTCAPDALIVVAPYLDQITFLNSKAKLLLDIDDNSQTLCASRVFKHCKGELISFTERVIDRGDGMSDALSVQINKKECSLEVTATLMQKDPVVLICMCLRDKDTLQKWRMKNSVSRQSYSGLLQWRHIHEVFQQIEKENQLILSAAGEGIYGVDAKGNTTFVNPAAERILGWSADELIGKNVHAAIHHSHTDGSDYCVHDCPIYAAFKDGAVHKVDNEVFWSKSGQPMAVEYTSTPIMDHGHLVGAVVVFRDISDRKETEAKLRKALAEVEKLKHKLELENAYLQEEISAGYNSYQIVGRSPAVQNTLQQVQLVAPTDATVLISGESGTGKELIARAIHTASDRSDRPLVRVNCAAIPKDLFESEFFGHVRGAFSGAHQDRPGRFQLADGGTLFLDEVGEIPLELQGKFLRVLQDSEFQRLGESTTRSVNVRVIAASNRDLLGLVQQGLFREDLYFRLNVFPVYSTALRDRIEDIPLLASHFLAKACKRFNKQELKISLETLRKLQAYHWPGNIRELENVIERQVILSCGEKLVLNDLPNHSQTAVEKTPVTKDPQPTEQECNRYRYEATVAALRSAKGKIYGKYGAAQMLGIKPTTLASRIKKLGIDKRIFA